MRIMLMGLAIAFIFMFAIANVANARPIVGTENTDVCYNVMGLQAPWTIEAGYWQPILRTAYPFDCRKGYRS